MLFLLVITISGLASGYTFVPSKRGGIMLSGIPTLMVSISMLSLCLAALLTIIDHYDRRPNEHRYEYAKYTCAKIALAFFICAPGIEILEHVLRIMDIELFPTFHGFAAHYTFYTPALSQYIPMFQPVVHAALYLGIGALVLGIIGTLLLKFAHGISEWVSLTIMCIGIFLLSIAFLITDVNSFLNGEISVNDIVYEATNEPAKFNAIMLTHTFLGLFILLGSFTGIMIALSYRDRLPSSRMDAP